MEPNIVHSLDALSQLRGVYFLLLRGQVMYIGQASNVITRIETHRKEGKKEFDQFLWISVSSDDITMLEAEYIWQFNPVYNEALPPNPRYKQGGEIRKIWQEKYGHPLPKHILSAKQIEGKWIAKVGGKHYDTHTVFRNVHNGEE